MGGRVERMGDDKLAGIRYPESGGEKQARKTETAFRDLDRVGGGGGGERRTTGKIGDGEC